MEDEESGPIIRMSPRVRPGADFSNYQDSIAKVDCGPFWRRFGLQRWVCFPRHLWLVKDVCGWVCAVITWMLIAYATFVIIFVVLRPEPNAIHSFINGVIFLCLAAMAVCSHLKAMVTDPGAVPRGNATKENIAKLGLKDGQVVYKCPKCVSIKPERAHHCSVCRRCIRKMDHHCPWVNNCVGENNQKFFVLFTMYICLISVHALYMTIHHFVVCISVDWKECTGYSPAATTIFLIFLLFEALLFGIFTAIMCGTQLSAICSDETGIEQLKNSDNNTWEKKSYWLSLKTVFGHPFSYKWFSPFHETNIGKTEVYLYTV